MVSFKYDANEFAMQACWEARLAAARLQAGECVVFVWLDIEQLVEAGDHEDFVDLGAEVAQAHLAASSLYLLVQHDQLVECSAGEEFHGGEIEDEVLSLFLFNQSKELVTQFLDVGSINDLSIQESN